MFQGVSRWLSNSVHLCVDVSIGQCTRYNFSKKIAQIFPHMCHAFCLRDFLLNMNVKKKKKRVIMRAQTVVLLLSVSVMKVSTDSISVKELNQIQKLL